MQLGAVALQWPFYSEIIKEPIMALNLTSGGPLQPPEVQGP